MAETKTKAPKMITIRFPLMRGKEEEDIYVAVNGESYLIKRGETVTIPEYVYKVLENQEEALIDLRKSEQAAQEKIDDTALN